MQQLFSIRKAVPVIMQSERAECGLACIAMIAGYFGYDVDLATLRQRHAFSALGATLRELVDVSGRIDLETRAIKAPLKALPKLSVPAVLHWGFDHFVVLVEASADGSAVIHDPATGRRSITASELTERYTGVAIEFAPSPRFVRRRERSAISFRQLLRGSLHDLKPLWYGVLFALLAQPLALGVPLVARFMIDDVVPTGSAFDIDIVGIGMAAIAVCAFIANMARGITFVFVGTAIHGHLARNLFHHLISLPLGFFQRQQSAELLSRFDSLRVLQRVLSVAFVESVVDGMTMIASVAIVSCYSVALGLSAFGCMGLYAALRYFFQRSYVTLNEEQLIKAARTQTSFIESMRGIESIKAHNGQHLRASAWNSLLSAWFGSTNRLQAHVSLFSSAATALQMLTFGLCVWVGCRAEVAGRLSLGSLLASLSLVQTFTFRLVTLVDKVCDVAMMRIHRVRLSDIYAVEPEAHMAGDERSTHAAQRGVEGRLELRDLAYRHDPSQPLLLDGLDFTATAGEFIAITGKSGEGKSTLLRLMLGLLAPQRGCVLLDGVDINAIGKARFRDHVAVVLQSDVLFSGTLAENISSFDPAPDMQRISECARTAGLHDVIARYPMGYRTLVGDMGSMLSGGQQQRVFLARALYRRPKILFLDEATSHMDTLLEREINLEISKLGITRIVIAHRPETIRAATRVLRLTQGKFVDITELTEESVDA